MSKSEFEKIKEKERENDLYTISVLEYTTYKMAMFALKNGMEQRAQRKAFDSIFKRFDHNQNGKNFQGTSMKPLRNL